jgi:hypothetical protein
MPKIYFNYMLAANTRLSDNLIAKYEQVSSDFILFRVLNLFIEEYTSDDASNTKENFMNQFFNINTTDIPNNFFPLAIEKYSSGESERLGTDTC